MITGYFLFYRNKPEETKKKAVKFFIAFIILSVLLGIAHFFYQLLFVGIG
jgi:hypothetical protein